MHTASTVSANSPRHILFASKIVTFPLPLLTLLALWRVPRRLD